jgi:IS5 family transposase
MGIIGPVWTFGERRVRMTEKRFKELGTGSFFGDYVYERAVPEEHFLRQLDDVVDWELFTPKLIRLYRGRAKRGRPPYDPVVILKMLLLSYLYDLSERQTEAYVNDSLSAKCFLGLAVDEGGPDHSTLTKFKERIEKHGQEALLEELLRDVIAMAMRSGVAFGSIQVVDSTHTLADVNVSKDDHRDDQGKPRRDRDAKWGVKGKKRGKGRSKLHYFFGYKMHTAMNAKSEMITSLVVTGGNAHDGKQFPTLVEKDGEQGLPIDSYAADRGYDDSENHYLLETLGMHSAIILNDYRTQKKDKNKEVWIDLKKTPQYQAGTKERYKIERKFGEAKRNHGLKRCRYVGRLRYAIQAYLTAIALNLKRMVKLLTGVSFKGRARAMA